MMKLLVFAAFITFCRLCASSPRYSEQPNILLILADDLGWSDTSVEPFTGNGAMTPNLEKMASTGMKLTNFHAAAAVCTPTRASILTGMNPWRAGVKAVFEYGIDELGKSNRNGWLPQVPTVAEAFRQHGYSTYHSGKWHLGGMRNDDWNLRTQPVDGSPMPTHSSTPQTQQHDAQNIPGAQSKSKSRNRCPHPGPNQQGFDEYVSVLDGPGAPRQNSLQTRGRLYSQGCQFLLNNDVPLGEDGGFVDGKQTGSSARRMTLSDCEAGHAVRMMKNALKRKKPFFMQLWFHAPHGPWEYIPGFEHLYAPPSTTDFSMWPLCHTDEGKSARFCLTATNGCEDTRNCTHDSYKPMERTKTTDAVMYHSMVSSMDNAIGYVMDTLKGLGIENNTLVVFTSDNGPEDSHGAWILRKDQENPWPDWKPSTNAEGKEFPRFTTALGPRGLRGSKRYLYEGGIRVPTIIRWPSMIAPNQTLDSFGTSTDLVPTFLEAAGISVPPEFRLDGVSLWSDWTHGGMNIRTEADKVSKKTNEGGKSGVMTTNTAQILRERVVFWFNDFEGPRALAARWNDFKLVMDTSDMPMEMYDLRVDPREINNLYTPYKGDQYSPLNAYTGTNDVRVASLVKDIDQNIKDIRSKPDVHRWIFHKLLPVMSDYIIHGNDGHKAYMQREHGRNYIPTGMSSYRHNTRQYRLLNFEEEAMKQKNLMQFMCATMCSCDTPDSRSLGPYPVDNSTVQYIQPAWPLGFVNATVHFLQMASSRSA